MDGISRSGHARGADRLAESVTLDRRQPKTGAERVAAYRARQKAEQAERERLKYRSDEWRQFVDPDGLQRKAGASWANMAAMVLRELADNAADAAKGKGASIEAVTTDGCDYWRISDQGSGIAPDEVARVFSVNRPMESTKHVRWPTRGMLGNGARVVAGYCAIMGLPITVESRGMRTVLRVDKTTGRTVIERQEPIGSTSGTAIYLPRKGSLADDRVHTLARRTLALAEPAFDAIEYCGPSSPWWYGMSDLLALLATAPEGATMSDVIRDMRLALPREVSDGLAAEATEDQAAALLTALRERNNPIASQRIGRIGRSKFDTPGYAIEYVTRRERSGAELPVVIEAWAICEGWKRRDLDVTARVGTYLNRSAVLNGLSASGGREAVHLQGAGLNWRRVEAKPGRYQVIVSIITPHAVVVSDGKAPDLASLAGAIADAVGKAMKLARRGVPPDDETPEERAQREAEAEANRRKKEVEGQRREQRRQQKEADEAAWRSIGGERVLLRTIEAEAEVAGLTVDDLTVGDARHDPFRADTPANHRIGRWLVDHMPEGRQLHLRGLHYLLVSTPGLVRPDGTPYRNDLTCWQWLQGALNAARWLGYCGFNRIEDERNAEPVWAPGSDPALPPGLVIGRPTLPDLPELADLLPGMELAWGGAADRQRYHICLLGEKTGLRPILAPLAEEFGADLLLPSGEPSNTMLHRLVKHAIADGRPLVILTFTDCDPTGQGIPASVGRKVQAMLALAGAGGLHVRVIPAGLTVEQARDLDLPSTPLKDTERRADRWRATTGREQTEIDALFALRPDVLVQIARDAIAPFYDAGLARRAREARQEWEGEARRIVAAALDRMPAHWKALQQLQQQHDAYATAHAAIGAAVGDLHAAMQRATKRAALPDLPALPEWQAPDVPMATALFDSADSFVANTRRLQAAKLRTVLLDDDEGRDEES